jgi:glycosyltransferase involved in cell wall biosynthesis
MSSEETSVYVALTGSSGYAVAAGRAVRAMAAVGNAPVVDYVTFVDGPLGRGWHPDQAAVVRRRTGAASTAIIHTPVDHVAMASTGLVRGRVVCHTVWETDLIPANWLDVLGTLGTSDHQSAHSRIDGLIVPTQWNAETLHEAGVTQPIHVVPHATEDRWNDLEPDLLERLLPNQVSDTDFVFTTVGVWQARKGLPNTLDAYLRAFSADDPVVLVVKTEPTVPTWDPTYRPGVSANTWWRLTERLRAARRSASKPPRVVLVVDDWTDMQMAALAARTNAYLSLPHAEGWGLGLFDCAVRGVPVITTRYGGPLEYLGPEYPGLVESTLIPALVNQVGEVVGRWADPSVEHASQLLRSVFEHRESWDLAAALTASRLRNECSPDRVGSLLSAASA